MIQLKSFFDELEGSAYCVIKYQEDKLYKDGDDIDIFCMNLPDVCKRILYVASEAYDAQEITAKVSSMDFEKHIYIDLLEEEKIIIRFDLYGELPNYKNVSIKGSLFSVILENAIYDETTINGENVKIRHASINDDILLRYIEYVEWYRLRPDKIKHLDYILKYVEDDDLDFLDRLHYYTEIPLFDTEKRKTSFIDRTKIVLRKLGIHKIWRFIVYRSRKMHK